MKIHSVKFMRGITGPNEILNDGVPQIAFVGRSNVGKSSVINSLLDEDNMARAGKKPGKTTEINFFLINKKFYFADLPGYGYAHLGKEEREKIRELILWYLMFSSVKPAAVVLILDIKAGFTKFDGEMLNILQDQGHRYIIVANKTDKLGQKELLKSLEAIRKESGVEDIVPCSAAKDIGRDELFKKIFGDGA